MSWPKKLFCVAALVISSAALGAGWRAAYPLNHNHAFTLGHSEAVVEIDITIAEGGIGADQILVSYADTALEVPKYILAELADHAINNRRMFLVQRECD